MKRPATLFFALAGLLTWIFAVYASAAGAAPSYSMQLNIPYCTVDGKTETLNAFLPVGASKPVPAMVEIHGGWFMAGGPARRVEDMSGSGLLMSEGLALFSISYRLGAEGGFPQNIRDCRNAIRFIRKNANRFNIDPERIGCMGGSAGGHLSLMVAMVPEYFDDGGPTVGLQGVSAKVCNCFSWIAPADFVRFWAQGPADDVPNAQGQVILRGPDPAIPNDARPHLRSLFHGKIPDTAEHKALYTKMCPIGHVSNDVPPLLICDGEKDPVVPGQHGKELHEKLKAVGADSTYWLTVGGGHSYPGGPGFVQVLDGFLTRTLKLGSPGGS